MSKQKPLRTIQDDEGLLPVVLCPVWVVGAFDLERRFATASLRRKPLLDPPLRVRHRLPRPRDQRPRPAETIPVTVCVAAMCQLELGNAKLPLVIGVSDRMLTSGDIQFQPETPKIFRLAPAVAVMTAGDIGVHAEILSAVRLDIAAWLEGNPGQAISVEQVARFYWRQYNAVKLRKAENEILAPLGLSADSFLSGAIATDIATDLARQMQEFRELGASAIVSGVDPTGAHIFALENGGFYCRDTVGFAAIGAGSWHASSHLMVLGHTSARPMPDTMFQTYYAKRRAEVAPGVGQATDMFLAGPTLTGFMNLEQGMLGTLGKMYEGVQSGIADGLAGGLAAFSEALMKPIKDKGKASTSPSSAPSSDDAGEKKADSP